MMIVVICILGWIDKWLEKNGPTNQVRLDAILARLSKVENGLKH